jgi:acyl-CoA thioester hydrolase
MGSEPFRRRLWARWGDMDFNGHMRNTAYLDAAGDVRMMFFAEHGFSIRDFERLRLGPVILRDELEYFRELRLLEPVDVTLVAAGSSPDGSRFRLRNEFFRADGQLAARLVSTGVWLDLAARRPKAPPETLFAAMREMPRGGAIAVVAAASAPGPGCYLK